MPQAYKVETTSDFEKALKVWRDKAFTHPVFYSTRERPGGDVVVTYHGYSPHYVIVLSVDMPSLEQATEQFAPVIKDSHGFIHHGSR